MTQQVERLVTMANQIARNFAGWGAEETVVAKTDEHLIKFWTPLADDCLLSSGFDPAASFYWQLDGVPNLQRRLTCRWDSGGLCDEHFVYDGNAFCYFVLLGNNDRPPKAQCWRHRSSQFG